MCLIYIPHFDHQALPLVTLTSSSGELISPKGEVGQGVRPLEVCRTRQEALEEVGSRVGGREQVGLGSEQPAFRSHTQAQPPGETVESLPCGAHQPNNGSF